MFTHSLEPTTPPHKDTPDLAAYLENVTFPKNREAILQVIEENTENDIDGNEAIMEHFRALPDTIYHSVEDVRQALGEEYGGK